MFHYLGHSKNLLLTYYRPAYPCHQRIYQQHDLDFWSFDCRVNTCRIQCVDVLAICAKIVMLFPRFLEMSSSSIIQNLVFFRYFSINGEPLTLRRKQSFQFWESSRCRIISDHCRLPQPKNEPYPKYLHRNFEYWSIFKTLLCHRARQ